MSLPTYAQERFRAEYREARITRRETGLAASRTVHGVGRPCFLYLSEAGKLYVTNGSYRAFRVTLQESIAYSRRRKVDHSMLRQLHQHLPSYDHPRLP